MKLNRNTISWGIFATLLLVSTSGFPLTLGRLHGAVILGKPLDVSVLVQYGADEDISPSCLDVEVHYGDTPLERSRIQLQTQAGQQPGTQLVRLTSNASVDEALVRLTLRSVCAPKASRSYTLLPDVMSELSGSAAAGQAARSSRAVAVSAEPVAPASSMAALGDPVAGAPAAPSASKPQAAKIAVARNTPTAVPKQPATGVAVPAKAAASVNAAALEDLQRRVDDIAKWQASSISAEDLQKSEARASALESDIRGLKAITAKNQQSILVVAQALESSSAQNHDLALLYGLGAILVLGLAGVAYILTRKRPDVLGAEAAPWWSGQDERQRASAVAEKAVSDQTAGAAATSLPASLQAATGQGGLSSVHVPFATETMPAAAHAVPEALAAVANPALEAQAPVLAGRSARPDFASSAPAQLKAINTKEMLDVRQQAEFFMALGQHDEAVNLLESNIQSSTDCNPLVFLDLLKIFHTLSRRNDFERYREEFNVQFTGRVPAYANFLLEGNGLEAYEDICQQIVVLWPTEHTVDFIEQCLVRLPEDDPEQGIDLEAFRDLLMLYGILKRLDQGYDSNLAPFSASRIEPTQNVTLNTSFEGAPTTPQPVSSMEFGAATAPVDIDLDLDLDLDLSEDANPPDQKNNLIDFDMSDFLVDSTPNPTANPGK